MISMSVRSLLSTASAVSGASNDSIKFKMMTLVGLISACCGYGPSAFADTNNTEAKTMIEVIAHAQRATTLPLIEHCKTQLPEMAEELDAVYHAFDIRMEKAMSPIIAAAKAQSTGENMLTPESLKELEGTLQEQAQLKIDKIKSVDATLYCKWLIEQIPQVSVENFRREFENGISFYMNSLQQMGRETAMTAPDSTAPGVEFETPTSNIASEALPKQASPTIAELP